MKENKRQLSKSPKKRKKKEQLSTNDIEELMGIHKPTYKRVHGSIRNK